LDIITSEQLDDSADSWREALRLIALYLKFENVSEDAAIEALIGWSQDTPHAYRLDPAIAKDAIKKAYRSRKTWSCREYQSSILGKDPWLECDRDACLWIDDHRAEASRKSQPESPPGPEQAGFVDEGIIQVNDRYLQEVSSDALAALRAHNEPPALFVRAGHLVRIAFKDRFIIEPINESSLRGAMARAAGFANVTTNKEGNQAIRKVNPPLDVARDVLSLGEWPGFPELTGIIEAPVLRPDGSVITTPGHDAATKLFYAPREELRSITILDNPTKADAVIAADFILSEVLVDFPFKDRASMANTLALLLTIVARPMIAGNVPLALLDKPQAGTGASLIADIASLIAIGTPAHAMGAPESDDEWRKAITSSLLGGNPIISIDNVEGKLRSPSLSRALTSKIWQDRHLGKSEMLDIPQRAIWVATGNNIQIGGDIARRAYWTRLDASMARPWLRSEFKHPNILEWTEKNRASILSALITIARAWVVAGRPPSTARALGGFKEWVDVIGGMLEFAGIEGFLENASELYDSMDQDIQQWDEFLGEWAFLHADNPIPAGLLRDELTAIDQTFRCLQDAMPEDVSEAVSRDRKRSPALARVLVKHLDQVYPSGRKLCRVVDRHTKMSLWKVCGRSPADDNGDRCGSREMQEIIPLSGYTKSEYSIYNRGESAPASPAGLSTDSGSYAGDNSISRNNPGMDSIEAQLQQADARQSERERHFADLAERLSGNPPAASEGSPREGVGS